MNARVVQSEQNDVSPSIMARVNAAHHGGSVKTLDDWVIGATAIDFHSDARVKMQS